MEARRARVVAAEQGCRSGKRITLQAVGRGAAEQVGKEKQSKAKVESGGSWKLEARGSADETASVGRRRGSGRNQSAQVALRISAVPLPRTRASREGDIPRQHTQTEALKD